MKDKCLSLPPLVEGVFANGHIHQDDTERKEKTKGVLVLENRVLFYC